MAPINYIAEELQRTMCEMVYKTIKNKMLSLQMRTFDIKFDSKYTIRLTLSYESDQIIHFKYFDVSGTYSSLDDINYKNITLKDPIFAWLGNHHNYAEKKIEIYETWIDTITKSIYDLIALEKKYETLIDKIHDLPLFAVERIVLIEKYKK